MYSMVTTIKLNIINNSLENSLVLF